MVIISSKGKEFFQSLLRWCNTRLFHTYRWKILLSYVLVSLLPLTFFFFTISNSLNSYFMTQRLNELSRQANLTASHIGVSNFITDESKSAIFNYDVEQTSREGSFRLIVVDNTGVVVADSNWAEVGKTMLLPEIIEALDKNVVVREQPNNVVYSAAPVEDEESEVVGAVLIATSSEDIRNLVDDVKRLLYFLSLLTVAIIVVLSFVLSKIIIDPIKKLLSVIQKMSDGYLNQRLTVKGHNEIAEVADAFNSMVEQLEQVDTSRQIFVSNVSHELKTPLSSIKVLSESILLQQEVPEEMYKEFLGDICNEVDRMDDIITDLLNLVKLDQKEVPIVFKMIDLNQIVEQILKRLYPIASQKNIELVLESLNDIQLMGDEVKLTLAISNLVENGIKYTPENGQVIVTLDSDHQNAFIKVEDTGVGIAEEELGKIFDRFYRVDKTRDRETGGTGLGLSITHATILLHNGSIKVTSQEDEGTVFVVRLPLQQAPQLS